MDIVRNSVVREDEEAQEYVWILSNQILMSTLKPLENSLNDALSSN